LVDVKTTSFIGRFDNEVAKFGYHGQLAFYADGLAAIEPASITPLIIAIQNEAPFDVVVFTMADAVEEGRKLYRRLLRQYIECRRTNYWPGICPKAGMPCVLPKWAREDESEL
jgi:hypothetical protein